MSAVTWPDDGDAESRMLGVLPYYHVYGARFLMRCVMDGLLIRLFRTFAGAVAILSLQYHRGAALVIMQQFEPTAFCSTIERYRVTQACVVPPICLLLSHHPGMFSNCELDLDS